MFEISNLCIVCLTYKNLKTILLKDNDGIVIKQKLKYCLPEIVDSQLDVQEYMCGNCMNKLDCFYEFKQCCLQNNTYLKNYLQTLTSTGEKYKHLLVQVTDINSQNKLEAKNKDQTLAIVASDDGGIKDYATCVKNEIEFVDVSDIKESHLLSDVEEDIIVKEECVTSENKDDIVFYHKFVNSAEHTSISSDFNVSVSDNKDEDSEDSINSNTIHNSTEAEKNMVKNTNKYQCAICGKELLYKQSLKYHLEAHAGFKAFNCTICNKKFNRKNHLNLHVNLHIGIKNFKCSICNKTFIYKESLTRHENVHNNIKNFECSICNKTFFYKENLNRHENAHNNIKNFECSICYKKFTQRSSLNSHVKIHTGVKDFECSICNKKFFQKTHLTRHTNIHSGVKNFQCSICNKKFSQKAHLTKHENIHSGVKNFECSICNKKFTLKSKLISHSQRIHIGVKHFECSTCNKKFVDKRDLVRHEKTKTHISRTAIV